MQRILFSSIILMFIVFLSACKNNDLSKSEVLSKLEGNMDDVNSYHAEVGLDIEVVSTETDKSLDKGTTFMTMDMDEENITMKGDVKSTSAQGDMTQEFYADEDTTFLKVNKSNWEKATDPNQKLEQDKFDYETIVDIVQDIEAELEMEEKDNQYILTFKGESQDVFDAFRDPYSLQVTGVTEDEVEHNVTVEVDKDTLFIEYIGDTIIGENMGEKLIFKVTHDYSDMNEIDEIEIPQKVKNEAI